MPKLKSINSEVVVIDEPLASLSRADLQELIRAGVKSPRGRMRLLTHAAPSDEHQEMIIVHTPVTYVRPHKHLGKVRSFQVYEGEMDMVIFDDAGAIQQTVRLSAYEAGGPFYYRLGVPVYYSLVIRSDYALFKETSVGPFVRSETIYASWSPDDSDAARVAAYRQDLEKKLPPYSGKRV